MAQGSFITLGGRFCVLRPENGACLLGGWQEGMMAFVRDSLGDADVVLMLADIFEKPDDFPDQDIFDELQKATHRWVTGGGRAYNGVLSASSSCVYDSSLQLAHGRPR
jgi:hypothetical protein